MIRFLHTADLQIGMPHHWAADRARQKLREYREEAIETIGELSSEHEVDFVLVAGDFFDENTVGDDVVVRACERLKSISVPVYILPGNHDCCGSPDSVYKRSKFTSNVPSTVQVIDNKKPLIVNDGKVVILPAPLERKNQTGDTTAHITAQLGQDEAPDATRIGLAHGGVTDFSEGEAMNRIDPDRAAEAELDYLALGDWHGLKQVNDRTWYSGTPEPNGFLQNDPGHVLLVEIEQKGRKPNVTPIQTAKTTWLRYDAEMLSGDDVEALERWFRDLDRPLQTLVRIELSGSLGLEEITRVEKLLSDMGDTMLCIRRRGGGIIPKPTDDEIADMASEGYVGLAVEQLRDRAELSDEEGKTAGRALELLYHLQQKA